MKEKLYKNEKDRNFNQNDNKTLHEEAIILSKTKTESEIYNNNSLFKNEYF